MIFKYYFICTLSIVLTFGLAYSQEVNDGNDEVEPTRKPITLEQVNAAANEALSNVESLNILEDELRKKGITTRRGSPSSFHQALFRGSPSELESAKWNGIIATETANSIVNNLDLPLNSRRNQISEVSLENAVVSNACPKPPICYPTRYRTIDGSCNNLDNISWGKSFTAFQRLMPAIYHDGLDKPRRFSRDRGPLPNPRSISTLLSPDVDIPSRRYTTLLMQWGQFLDHDITNTALTTASNGLGITCCAQEVRSNSSLRHPACFPIEIPSNDLFYSSHAQDCMEFVRSMAAPVENCKLGQRQQLNIITGFIDGSVIYGSTVNDSRRLRSFERGKLKSSPTHGSSVMPPDNSTICGNDEDQPPCFLAGDNRVNEQTLLTVFHQIWFREHNRIAGILAGLNKGWNDEVLYQEARRIVGAILQHITYNEFLPILLGQRTMASYRLNVQRYGHSHDYDIKVNPTLSNVFSTAAFRLGHTLVQGNMSLVSRGDQVTDALNLRTQFFTPMVIYEEAVFDMLVTGLYTTPSQSFDPFFTDQLTNHLFQPPGFEFGLDLVALNIQRGRDHGLPTYTDWREYCQLAKVSNFDELREVMNSRVTDVLRQLYRHVQDIDLYVAGISERPNRRDALLPPTFACLVAEQFRRLKIGDRFWYENGDMESSFSEPQLDEIRKVTLSRILCDNSNIHSIQRNPFFQISRRNPVEPCIQGNIPRMSLDPWINEPVWVK